MKLLKKQRALTLAQRSLIAHFLMQIAVAWFVAGVISIFVEGAKTLTEVLSSLAWGLSFSLIFLMAGMFFLRGKR